MASKMIAPSVAVRMVPRPELPVFPAKPSRLSTQPPINAPKIPIRAVTITPPGSGPGMTHFARIPAISPTTTQATMAPLLMALHLPHLHRARTGLGGNILTDGVPRATFVRFYPHAGGHKHRAAYPSEASYWENRPCRAGQTKASAKRRAAP